MATLLVCLAASAARVEEYGVDPSRRGALCEGWGVSLCWWAAQCGRWPEERLDSLVDWLVSPEGLNYSVFRYNIPGGDDPEWRNCDPHHFRKPGGKGMRAEMEGFRVSASAGYDWTRDEAQRRIMLMIREKRPDAVFEAFANSAPWWMTASGCVAGAESAVADNVPREMYDAFARYLVDVCLRYRDEYGIEFATLDPFNEPMTDYWRRNGGQEGCHFGVDGQIAFVRRLHGLLRESGLATAISASDETDVGQSVADLLAYGRAGVLPMVGQWNTHTYEGTVRDKELLRHVCDSLGLRLWQSETGSGGRGLMGNLRMAQRLVDDIRYLQPSVWCDWQYVEQDYDQWSLVSCGRDWGQYRRHANYYVRQHFSRFVPAGYSWLHIDDACGLAAVSADGARLVYVTINASRHGRSVRLSLPEGARLLSLYRTSGGERCDEVACGEGDMLEIPPMSIITAVYDL